jgi:hypothetical protein
MWPQADFSVSKCPVCGLMYAKGEQADEKVHSEYHRKAVKGFAFKASEGNRVSSKLLVMQVADAMLILMSVLPAISVMAI